MKSILKCLLLLIVVAFASCTRYMPDGRAYRINCWCVESHSETSIRYDQLNNMWLPETHTVCNVWQTDTIWHPELNRKPALEKNQ